MPRTPGFALVVLACAALLAGCGDSTEPAAAPVARAAPASSKDPSLPQAAVPAVPSSTAPTSTDSAATDPKGKLSAEEASKSMPMAGQGNNHSSPALEPPSKN